ncbi:uncharacterized protein CIMG_06337 [Coccidioides immitis RS]|uniref:Serine/arginine repetitive matrix protein 1 n=2 Tax=Coccidioides immitis TaxID=5501 RepID=J3K7Y4_COCIM|nr:uncharacterized protein CIMG_06337 [Coccidioides immitis RS]EAS30858.3 hypothetical protein CIMG_06337 [Coccidioides immitis RS]KMP03444.1 hypothetical protein CIRG_03136 [Coccidioides immitis RMSCC 2394]TPX23738.1 hypothetical protein DIZ76_013077 [Coccidioides immitis]
MDRDRYDRRYDEGRRGGESYRPADRLPRRSPRPDIRFGRSPVRNRSPPPIRPTADTWAPSDRARPRSRSPGAFRRRSRSPPYRGGDRASGYGGRPRSPPPPRRFSPRRENGRSPPRSYRRSRSPPAYASRRSSFSRGGSPGCQKRAREASPTGYAPRSPKRERIASPPRSRYDRPRSPPIRPEESRVYDHMRPRSPDRRDGWRESYGGRSWRRRSPSPLARSGPNSGPGSSSTSRRSSPPPRTDRGRGYGSSISQAPAYSSRAHPSSTLPPRSPPPPFSSKPLSRPGGPVETRPSRPHSPPRGPRSGLSNTPSNSRALEPSPGASVERERDFGWTPRPASREPSSQIPINDNQMAKTIPPRAPSSNSAQAISPPPGPSGPKGAEMSVRGGHAALLSAPTRPKGAAGPHYSREPVPRDSPRGGSLRRPNHGPPYHGPPPGSRGARSPSSVGYDSHRPPFRHGNSTSTTYPRTQRFTNHLSGLPSVIPGGKLVPSGLDPAYEKRIAQLEADKERLLEQIAEKQKSKRTSLREWDKLSRESATGALRSELAEGHLQRMAEGDDIGGGAAF